MHNKLPVQIWSPLFYKSLFGEFNLDLERAYNEWKNEDTIWLIPGIKEVIRWEDTIDNFIFINAAIPSDNLNMLSIYHIDEQDRIYPPFTDVGGKNIIKESLYKKWLETYPEQYPGSEFIEINMPVIKDNKFSHYDWKKIKVIPGPMVPITDVKINEHTFNTRWPSPESDTPKTISPEVESKRLYGKLRFEKIKYNIDKKDKIVNVVSSEKKPEGKAINVWLKWPEPFDSIFPDGGSIDLMYHNAHMRNLIRLMGKGGPEKQKAILKATNWLNVFVGNAETTIGKAFVLPRLIENTNAMLIDVEYRYGIEATSLKELFSLSKFEQLYFDRIKIKRIYSWLGYFWWQFYNDISENMNIRFCESCGNIIVGGRSDKVSCSKEENINCFKQRQAKRQRKSYYKNR